MAATSSGEVGFSAVRIRESGVTLADENWLNDVDANITTAITGYLDAISSLPLGAEIRLDDVKHEQYLKKFQKLKTTLQLRALRCEDEGNNFLLSMVLDRLGKMTSRHKEMKHKIPHFSYAVSTKDAELQARAVIDGYQAKYQALINDPEALPYRLLTSYTKLKSAYLTLMHSISSEDPYRKVVENTFAGIRAVHRTLPLVKEMKLMRLIPLSYGMLVKFCKNNKIKGYVPRTFKDIKAQIAEISSYVLSHAEAVECDFIYNASSEEMEKKWEIIKLLPESKELKFSVYEGSASKRFIQSQSNSKLCEEDLTFVDGDLKGRRVYLDGREESGIFDPKWGCLIRGYRTNVAKEIELVDPVEVFRWDLDRNQSMRVFEFLDELCLMERYFVQGHARFRSAEGNLLDFLLNASMRTSGNFSIKKVLGHSSFSSLKNEFISRALGSDGFGAVRLLDFSNQALSDVLDEIDLSKINPLRIVKERTSSDLITRVAYFATSENGGREIMDKLKALFPEEFNALGPNLLVTVLRAGIINGYDLVFLRDCIERYEASGGVLSPFHRAWVETAFGQVPHWDVALFSPDEQAFLEETAYAVGNCHI
ncbi:MAG: hypothetical protein K2X08_03355, partial [Chlamydiales bacterium]|nr:hypothetical protein [Chlamydiales bacterium]